MEKLQGSGSVWNPNNWHWEQKNYTEQSKIILTEIIQSIKLQDGDMKIENTKVKNIKGDAEISIRKSKQVFLYELSTEVEWTATSNGEMAEGSYKINEITQDGDDITLDHVKSEEKSNLGTKAINLIKKQMLNKYKELMKDFTQKIQQIESDPNKISEQQKKKEQAAYEFQVAREQNGDLKEQISIQQKEKENKMKEENFLLSQKQKQQEKQEQVQQEQVQQQQQQQVEVQNTQ